MVRHEVRTVFPEAKCRWLISQPRQPKQWVPSQTHHQSQFLKNFSSIPKEPSEKLVRSLLLKSNGITQRRDKNIVRIPTNLRYRKYHFCVSFPTNPLLRLYVSIDPAPPTSGLLSGTPKPDDVSATGVQLLHKDLINENLPLFQRYRAMFALRNIGTPAAVDALASGFSDDSALFKYVFNSLYILINSI